MPWVTSGLQPVSRWVTPFAEKVPASGCDVLRNTTRSSTGRYFCVTFARAVSRGGRCLWSCNLRVRVC